MNGIRNLTIRAVDEEGIPLHCHIKFVCGDWFQESTLASVEHTIPSAANFIGELYEIFIEAEDPGFHPARCGKCFNDTTVVLRRISDESLAWASKFLNFAPREWKNSPPKIGVVDGFPPSNPPGLGHVRIAKWSNSTMPDRTTEDIWAHGITVVNILSNFLFSREETKKTGEESIITVYPVQCKQIGDDLVLPIDMIEGAIQAAIIDGCDIINLSLGLPDEISDWIHGETKPFARELGLAKQNDVILVAATGNKTSEQVYLPAKGESVFGIGMLGLESEVRSGSATESYMHEATTASAASRISNDPQFGKLFVAGAVGEGANFVFPGCGICFLDNFERPIEVSGTSYAAPIATAVLARTLSDVQISGKGFHSRPRLDDFWELARKKAVQLGAAPWFATIKY